MSDGGEPGVGGLLLRMGVFVALGAPLVFLVWRFMNGLLAGRPDPAAGLQAGFAAVGLVLLLVVLGRRVRRWHGSDSP